MYFLTLDMAPAASLAGIPTLRVTHTPGTPCLECDAYLPAEGSAAENASFDVPLLQEVALQRTASFAVVADTFGGDGFADGFESGRPSSGRGPPRSRRPPPARRPGATGCRG